MEVSIWGTNLVQQIGFQFPALHVWECLHIDSIVRCLGVCVSVQQSTIPFGLGHFALLFFPFFVGVYVTLYGMHVNEQLLCEFSI